MGSFFEREAKSEPPVSEERSSCVSELATTWRSTVHSDSYLSVTIDRKGKGDGQRREPLATSPLWQSQESNMA